MFSNKHYRVCAPTLFTLSENYFSLLSCENNWINRDSLLANQKNSLETCSFMFAVWKIFSSKLNLQCKVSAQSSLSLRWWSTFYGFNLKFCSLLSDAIDLIIRSRLEQVSSVSRALLHTKITSRLNKIFHINFSQWESFFHLISFISFALFYCEIVK